MKSVHAAVAYYFPSDNYVHRLVHNKEDGKLVEVGGHGTMVSSKTQQSDLAWMISLVVLL